MCYIYDNLNVLLQINVSWKSIGLLITSQERDKTTPYPAQILKRNPDNDLDHHQNLIYLLSLIISSKSILYHFKKFKRLKVLQINYL